MLYPSFAPRITTYDASGNALHRWTLQQPLARGRVLTVEVVAEESFGRPPKARRAIVVHGYRLKFECQWDLGLTATQELWSGTAWVAPTEMAQMTALLDIAQACENWPVLVEASIGISDTAQFLGRTFNDAIEVMDQNGILHKQLAVTILGESLLATLPDFLGYFVPGYIDSGYFDSEGNSPPVG